jgi:hypothetical protein
VLNFQIRRSLINFHFSRNLPPVKLHFGFFNPAGNAAAAATHRRPKRSTPHPTTTKAAAAQQQCRGRTHNAHTTSISQVRLLVSSPFSGGNSYIKADRHQQGHLPSLAAYKQHQHHHDEIVTGKAITKNHWQKSMGSEDASTMEDSFRSPKLYIRICIIYAPS